MFANIIHKLQALPRRTLLIMAGGSVVVVVAIVGVAMWAVYTQANATGRGIVDVPADLMARHQQEVDHLLAEGKYDEAHKAAAAAIESVQPDTEKYEVAMGDGASAETKQDYAAALAAYQRAAAIHSNELVSEAIGRVADKMGNKQLAIDSYTKALAQIVKSPISDATTERLQHALKVLTS